MIEICNGLSNGLLKVKLIYYLIIKKPGESITEPIRRYKLTIKNLPYKLIERKFYFAS